MKHKNWVDIECQINGKTYQFCLSPAMSLMELLREQGLTSVKQGCGVGECGACTVLIDGVATDSCLYLAVWADGKQIRTAEGDTRYKVTPEQDLPGVSPNGITEDFPTDGARSYYGASKLASEMLAQEYAAAGDLNVIINRCGVLAGAGQFGKVDQGVMALWVAAHIYGRPLKYIGFGGTGKQVRDLMHPDDLLALVMRQIEMAPQISGQVFNVGGGLPISVSLIELTELCRARTGNEVEITPVPETASVDVPVYLTDTTRVREATGWSPSRDAAAIIDDIATWIEGDIERLRPIFA